MGPDALQRWGRVMDYITHVTYEKTPPPHWYLSILAVDPPYQRQGIGSALIQFIVRQADATGLPCALDTTLAPNVGYFQRHGFQVALENVEPESGIRFWSMWREPGAPAA
jgi:ribosomal protein S18 acetylase RimI-like enzyme